MTRVVVLDDYQSRAHELAEWGRLGPSVDVTFVTEHLDHDGLVVALEGVEIVVAMRERTALPNDVIDALGALRLIVTTGMANASIDIAAAEARAIVVSGTASGGSTTIELAWALIMTLVKHIGIEDQAIRDGKWQTTLAGNLAGHTIGLCGLGRLGRAMVPVAQSFAMEIIAWSENLTEERAGSVGARAVSKDELFSLSDVLSIHQQLSPRTIGLVGRRELALMKPTAYLVNTSRGPIVDEEALIETLEARRIAGAGLDVFSIEPLPVEHRFRSLDNTVLSPHLGYASEDNVKRMYQEAIEDIEAFLAGDPLRVLHPRPS